jgi:hypothetical protein
MERETAWNPLESGDQAVIVGAIVHRGISIMFMLTSRHRRGPAQHARAHRAATHATDETT